MTDATRRLLSVVSEEEPELERARRRAPGNVLQAGPIIHDPELTYMIHKTPRRYCDREQEAFWMMIWLALMAFAAVFGSMLAPWIERLVG